jgi:hypothetical protein
VVVKVFRWADGADAAPVHTDRLHLDQDSARKRFAKALQKVEPQADPDQVIRQLIGLKVRLAEPPAVRSVDPTQPHDAVLGVSPDSDGHELPVVFLPGGPVTIQASGNVSMAGAIDIRGTEAGGIIGATTFNNAGLSGAGGFAGGSGSNGIAATTGGTGLGPGGGAGGAFVSPTGGGGGGGGYLAAGGNGDGGPGSGGTAYGAAALLPLMGGSGGGGGGSAFGGTGGGGGGGGPDPSQVQARVGQAAADRWTTLETTAWSGGTDKLWLAAGVLSVVVNANGEPSHHGEWLWIRNTGTTPVYYSGRTIGRASRELLPKEEHRVPIQAFPGEERRPFTSVPLAVRHSNGGDFR